MHMKIDKITSLIIITLLFITSCSSDDNNAIPTILPSYAGKFTDSRDGKEYNYVRIGNLEWTTDNAKYDTKDDYTRSIYSTQQILGDNNSTNDSLTVAKFGYLYSYEGAKQAVPEGWRLPTDEDWKNLEISLNMSESDANSDGWRGNYQAMLMHEKDGTQLNLKYGGFMDGNSTTFASKFYYIEAFGYYWTDTFDKSTSTAYYRKIVYNSGKVYRHLSATNNMMSVRFVRDAK